MAFSKFPKFSLLLSGLVAVGSISNALAQGTNQYGTRGGYVATPGGSYGTGSTGVRTGQGPLSQPIPPATSLANPNQNYYSSQTPNRPQNNWGPAVTNPSQNPFGVGPR